MKAAQIDPQPGDIGPCRSTGPRIARRLPDNLFKPGFFGSRSDDDEMSIGNISARISFHTFNQAVNMFLSDQTSNINHNKRLVPAGAALFCIDFFSDSAAGVNSSVSTPLGMIILFVGERPARPIHSRFPG